MHWKNETTGKLKPIVRRAMNGEQLSAEDQHIMDTYLEQVPPGADPLSLHSADETLWSVDSAIAARAKATQPAAAAAAEDPPPVESKRKPERTPDNKLFEPPENKSGKPKVPPEKHGGKGALGKLKRR